MEEIKYEHGYNNLDNLFVGNFRNKGNNDHIYIFSYSEKDLYYPDDRYHYCIYEAITNNLVEDFLSANKLDFPIDTAKIFNSTSISKDLLTDEEIESNRITDVRLFEICIDLNIDKKREKTMKHQ